MERLEEIAHVINAQYMKHCKRNGTPKTFFDGNEANKIFITVSILKELNNECAKLVAKRLADNTQADLANEGLIAAASHKVFKSPLSGAAINAHVDDVTAQIEEELKRRGIHGLPTEEVTK